MNIILTQTLLFEYGGRSQQNSYYCRWRSIHVTKTIERQDAM